MKDIQPDDSVQGSPGGKASFNFSHPFYDFCTFSWGVSSQRL